MFRFGHYEVLETSDGAPLELGRGAMGITYKALDTALQRTVALKVINPDNLAGDSARQRFLREARAAAQLKHPNVASVFHLGEEGGTHFYAMEFVEGETLESVLQRNGPLPCGFALEIAAQVAAALAAAHAAHLVHRDIKPANLMIVQGADGKFTVKVIDFGLAKTSTHAGPNTATLTMSGFVGTPHFASPEQLEEKEVDIRSDIYSLGATLWHMITGRTLFTGSLVRVMVGQISEAPPFERLAAPPEIIRLLRAMLAKDPAERPQTPAALLSLIQEVARTIDPAFICDGSSLSGESWTGFTLQELLRVRRVLPLCEVLLLLGRLVETTDAIGPLGVSAVDLQIHSVAIDFAKPPTASPHDSMLRSISEWPAFNIKFRNIDNVGKTSVALTAADETMLAPVSSAQCGGYIQRLGALVYELLGGKLRADSEFVPLAALSEGGNAVLKSALDPASSGAYKTGAEFHAALKDGGETGAPIPKSVPLQTANPAARTAHLEIVPALEEMSTEVAIIQPRPKRRRLLPTIAILILLGSIAGAAILWVRHGSPKTLAGLKHAAKEEIARLFPPQASPLAEKKLAPSTTPSHPSSPAPTPKTSLTAARTPIPPKPSAPPATPVLSREQRLQLALGEKAQYEAAGDSLNTLASAVKLAKGFPEYDKGLAHLDETILKVRDSGIFKHDWKTYSQTVNEAAELGSSQAMLIMGEHIRKTQPERALSLFRASAEKGVAEAMTEMGIMYLRGDGVPQDAGLAEKWFIKASDANDPSGTCVLAEAYLNGRNVKQDTTKAVQLLQDAAGHHSGDAKNLLGKIYLHGLLGFPANKLNATELFKQAKDLNCPEAFYNLGIMNLAMHGPAMNRGRAAALFKKGADLGNALSMFYYAKCLEEGIGVPVVADEAKQWYAKASEMLKRNADDGWRDAMLAYAMSLEGGKGVERNPTGASHYYSKAAALGDPTAEKWCSDHRVFFRVAVSSPGDGLLFLPHGILKSGTTGDVKTP